MDAWRCGTCVVRMRTTGRKTLVNARSRSRVQTDAHPLPPGEFFLGIVEQLYRMRDRGIPAALRKLNRMRDCVVHVLMKKVVTVLLPLASVLLLVAARKDL